jgi:hypothetical protein
MIEIEHSQSGDIITLRASGTLSKADYDAALPEIENALTLAKGPLQMLIRLWKDLTFDLKHRGEFGSIAVVGDTKLEEWGAWLSSFFAKSEVRYFSFEDEDDARGWLSKT